MLNKKVMIVCCTDPKRSPVGDLSNQQWVRSQRFGYAPGKAIYS